MQTKILHKLHHADQRAALLSNSNKLNRTIKATVVIHNFVSRLVCHILNITSVCCDSFSRIHGVCD